MHPHNPDIRRALEILKPWQGDLEAGSPLSLVIDAFVHGHRVAAPMNVQSAQRRRSRPAERTTRQNRWPESASE